MNNIIPFIIAAMIGTTFFSQSYAGILIEPYFGYNLMGKEDSSDYDFSGLGYGLRVGFTRMGLMVGIGYEMADWDMEIPNAPDGDAELSELYAFIGYEFPVLVRVWAGYAFQSKVTYNSDNATGKGIRLGVGYTGLPFASINLEYQKRDGFSHDDITQAFRENDDFQSYLLSVSIPFSL